MERDTKKKKTHTHTFFFNEESTINDTLQVGVKSFNEESTLNDTYKQELREKAQGNIAR